MKALILTMTCGNGHNSVAKSMEKKFSENGVECQIYNIYESDARLKKLGNSSYVFMCKYFPKIYSVVWNLQRRRNPNRRYHGFGLSSIKKVFGANAEVINDYAPDVIVCTHVYASNIVCNLKRQKKINENIKVYTFLLDYCCCPYYEDSILVDAIFTPKDITHPELLSKGYTEKQLHDFGYPVNEKFYKEINREEVKKKYEIDNGKTVVLSISGGNGIGNTPKLIKVIKKADDGNLFVINVCGNNKKIKDKIDNMIAKKQMKNIVNLGFVDNMEELMAIADVLFMRAGGIGLSEPMHMGLVPIIRERTQANETINRDLFLERNMCYAINKTAQAKDVIKQIINNKADLEEKRKNLKAFNNPNATEKIFNFIMSEYNSKN